MKVAIITSKKSRFWPGILSDWFTGCKAYHVGFYSDYTKIFYDMNVMRRRQPWELYYNPEKMTVDMFECPVLEKHLNEMILDRTETYGVADYFLFIARWLGFKVKNRKGLICSELVNIASQYLISKSLGIQFDKNDPQK